MALFNGLSSFSPPSFTFAFSFMQIQLCQNRAKAMVPVLNYIIIFVLLRLYKKRLFYLSVILYLPLNLNLVLQDHNYQNLFFPMTSSFLPYNLELTSGLLPSHFSTAFRYFHNGVVMPTDQTESHRYCCSWLLDLHRIRDKAWISHERG